VLGGRAEGRVVLDVLAQLPGGRELSLAADGIPGVYLVGGAVRDLLLGGRPRELDVVVEGDPAELIARLAAGREPASSGAGASRLDGPLGGGAPGRRLVQHARFATASVEVDGGRVDVARSRREHYARPGALPSVEPAPLDEDLLRRDFTVNAIAVGLGDGRLRAAPTAVEDLDRGLLRVLHDESFTDDPTRLLRLARLRVRLGFAVERHTAELAARAGLATVSGARIGAELRLALAEPDPVAALAAFAELPGLPLDVDRDLIGRALELLSAAGEGRRGGAGGGGRGTEAAAGGDGAGRPELLMLGAASRRRGEPGWLGGLELTAAERDVVLATWRAEALAVGLRGAATASELRSVLAGEPVEAVALAGALGPADAAFDWLARLRHVSLEIDGDDLVAAGVAPGPELGRRLERTLARKLDGLLAGGREDELASALAAGAGDESASAVAARAGDESARVAGPGG
jgi:tRNA nucleotidyltransferase (CCA-adding enzyme)